MDLLPTVNKQHLLHETMSSQCSLSETEFPMLALQIILCHSYMNARAVAIASLVSKSWHACCRNDAYWRPLCKRTWPWLSISEHDNRSFKEFFDRKVTNSQSFYNSMTLQHHWRTAQEKLALFPLSAEYVCLLVVEVRVLNPVSRTFERQFSGVCLPSASEDSTGHTQSDTLNLAFCALRDDLTIDVAVYNTRELQMPALTGSYINPQPSITSISLHVWHVPSQRVRWSRRKSHFCNNHIRLTAMKPILPDPDQRLEFCTALLKELSSPGMSDGIADDIHDDEIWTPRKRLLFLFNLGGSKPMADIRMQNADFLFRIARMD